MGQDQQRTAAPARSGRVRTGVTFGLSLYSGQQTAGTGAHYRDLVSLAVAAEAAGFDLFWVSEHHDFDDGYLPSPLVALAAAAAATTTIGLGTGVALGPLAHPLRLAEDAAVVDHLSDGRLVLGLGVGYAPGEYRMFGVPMAGRGARLAETVRILRRAGTGERFSHHGRHYDLDDVRVRPAARRPAGIPLWLGGYAEAAVRRAGLTADGHLVGRGAPELVDAAESVLIAVRDPSDPTFTFGVNLALVGDDIAAGGESARHAFAVQQQAYEQVQAGTDVYADRLTVTAGPGLDLTAIDSYIQINGDTPAIVRGIVAAVAARHRWARLHLALRAVFPGEDHRVVADRIAYLGRAVLPAVRAELANRDPISRDPISRDPISRDPISRDPISRDPISRDPISRDPISRDRVSGDRVSHDRLSPGGTL
jgi:alkanesulfonate monooxygenase SsuD/methylene tetrahydromethanopterin reductase-like flavin-dependent oxidoreductase (luciferase family)